MMLGRSIMPKTKADLIRSIQSASFRSFDVLEGRLLDRLPSKSELARKGATVIVLRG